MKALVQAILFNSLLFFFVFNLPDNNETECLDKNKNLTTPLFNGRYCFNRNGEIGGKNCNYVFPLNLSYIEDLEKANQTCGTKLETCLVTSPKHLSDYSSCYMVRAEYPYNCCFLRIKKIPVCYPIDIHTTENFRRTKHYFKSLWDITEATDVKIECSSYKKTITLSFLLFGLVFLLL